MFLSAFLAVLAALPARAQTGRRLPRVPLGSQGLQVSTQGLGTMGMTAFYGADPREAEETNMATLDKAQELGIDFLDTAWIYQHFESGATNEELVGRAIAKHGRDKWVIATKFGIAMGEAGLSFNGSKEVIRSQLADSLKRLGTDYIDLYYQHRMDPDTPIEETMAELKALVAEGKIKYIGLSECTADELRRAHDVHPITAIQIEWSIATRDVEAKLVPTARELGVGIVAYSPLNRGLLSRTFTTREEMKDGDFRKNSPRFESDKFQDNKKSGDRLHDLASKMTTRTPPISVHPTAAKLALAWVHAQGKDVVPIPGTTKASRLVANSEAVLLSKALEKRDLEALAKVVEGLPGGDRYAGMHGTFNLRESDKDAGEKPKPKLQEL